MKRITLLAALLAVSAMFTASSPVWAMRDPDVGGMPMYDYDAGASTPPRIGQYIPGRQFAGGMNLYAYAASNPVVLLDPFGMQATRFVVSGWTVKPTGSPNEPVELKMLRAAGFVLGQKHHNMYYDGTPIWIGWLGPAQPGMELLGENAQERFLLQRASEGGLSWGKYKGLECRCATEDKIKDCIVSAPKGNYSFAAFQIGVNDCQTDCERVTKGCCLTGYEAPSRIVPRTVQNLKEVGDFVLIGLRIGLRIP